MFIDIHSHVLPNVDDGSSGFEESFAMLNQAHSSGTDIMIATPHFHNRSRGRTGIEREDILYVYKKLKSEAALRGIPVNLYLGCEALLTDESVKKVERGDFIPLNGSGYALVEFGFDESAVAAFSYARRLVSAGISPVIAHPERYRFLQDDAYEAYRFLDIGCLLQVNKDSPLGAYGDRAQKCSRWLLSRRLVHVMAGDCHNTLLRNADMGPAYEWMIQRFEKDYIMTLLHDNPKRILLDKSV